LSGATLEQERIDETMAISLSGTTSAANHASCLEAEAISDRHVMMRVCSMGDNCEIGFAQRAYGAEPLDLFRWASTPVGLLAMMLKKKLAGIGDIEVDTLPHDYLIRHAEYRLRWHAFTNPAKVSVDELLNRERRRLPFLASKLIDDIAEGQRLFVLKSARPFDEALMARVLAAMDLFGRPTVMFVNAGAPVQLEWAGERIIRGSIPKFAHGGCVPRTTVSADWLALCRQALALMN